MYVVRNFESDLIDKNNDEKIYEKKLFAKMIQQKWHIVSGKED